MQYIDGVWCCGALLRLCVYWCSLLYLRLSHWACMYSLSVDTGCCLSIFVVISGKMIRKYHHMICVSVVSVL